MELWVFLAIAAAFFQTIRFMLQKQLSAIKLSASGATFARFLYSAPIAVIAASLYVQQSDTVFTLPNGHFWAFGILGGTAQITATVCTVLLFGRRNFAVGLTVIKTAVLWTAVIGFILLGDQLSAVGAVAISIGFSGVLVLNGSFAGDKSWSRRILSPSMMLGMTGGALFGVSGVSYRGASLLVESGDPFERALITLAAVTSMQLIGMALWLAWRDRAEIGRVLSAWRSAGFIGLTSIAGSFCWFTGFTLQNAAYVNAVGQVEVIFGIFASTLFFKERISMREYIGIALITVSVVFLVIWV